MLSPQIHPCPHCDAAVEGPEGSFCCQGCEMAWGVVHDAGLADWYAHRQRAAPRSRGAGDVAWEALPVTTEGGVDQVQLQVDGLRCASCVWLVEHVLEQQPGVKHATVSYATGRASLGWDPEVTSLETLAGLVSVLGYRPRPVGASARWDRDLLLRLGVATFSALNTMGLSAALYAGWLDGIEPRFATLFRWLSLLTATPAVTWSAAPFFTSAWQGLRHRQLHMDLPIALAVGSLFIHGVWMTVHGADTYLDSVTMLVALLLAGRVIEARGRSAVADVAASLSAQIPRRAQRWNDGVLEQVDSDQLRSGDQVAVGLGAEVPGDGVVVDGRAMLQMSLVSGESEPVAVQRGSKVAAGAVVMSGVIDVTLTEVGEGTLVGRMATWVSSLKEGPRQPTAADRLAPAFTAITLLIAALTAAITASTLGATVAIERTAAVLVVACPCALALAHPLLSASAMAVLARRGLLIRSPEVWMRLGTQPRMWLDKTGTLTRGVPRVSGDAATLRIAAGLERGSRHPIALAILDECHRRGLAIPMGEELKEVAGVGVEGRIDGVTYRLRAAGPGVLVLRGPDSVVGLLHLQDQLEDGVKEDLARVEALGLELGMLTGDHVHIAERIGAAAGIATIHAAQRPLDKAACLAQHNGVFVGDGVNDTAALAQAAIGIAPSTGSPAALQAADGVLVCKRLGVLADAIMASRETRSRVRINLIRSATYNAVAVAAAAAGWVNPLVAAVLMPLSSGVVLFSAWRLGRDLEGSAP